MRTLIQIANIYMLFVHWPNRIFIALTVHFIKLLWLKNQQKSYSSSIKRLYHDFLEINKSKVFNNCNRFSALSLNTKTPTKIHYFLTIWVQTHYRWSVYKINVRSCKTNVESSFLSETWNSTWLEQNKN
jgi:hypothetical protein